MIRTDPPTTILIPTSNPTAHTAVPGSPETTTAASTRSITPLNTIHSHRPESCRLCSKANMMVATPSMMKKAINTYIRASAPLLGTAINMQPTPIAKTADSNAHQNTGACRPTNVLIRPISTLTTNSQPRKISTAQVPIGGIRTAKRPSRMRMTPSTTMKRQCARTDVVNGTSCSWFVVMSVISMKTVVFL